MCPNKNKPGVFEQAQKNKAKREKAMAKRGSGYRWAKREPDLDDFSKKARKKLVQQVMASFSKDDGDEEEGEDLPSGGMGRGKSVHSPRGSPTGPSGRGAGKTVYQFLFDVVEHERNAVALQHGPPRVPLPVAINTSLPHIPLKLGMVLDDPNSPTVMCVVDTAAALTTGNMFFTMKLAKMFPHCVVKIHTVDDCMPITLTGIVKSDVDGTKTSTELPVALTFSLPYLTNDGSPTNVTVACGPDVSVNIILGWPFIQATQMVIDAAECVAECRALDCQPFPIEQKRTRVDIPQLTGPANVATKHGALLQELEALESYWACVYAINPATGEKKTGKKRASSSTVEKQLIPASATDDSGAARVTFALDVNGVNDTYYDAALGAEQDDDEA